MGAIQNFYEATNQLLSTLENDQDRDRKIEKVEALLEEREKSMAGIQPPFSDSEQELGKKLIELNEKVSQLLEEQKVEIQRDIKQLSVKKESSNKYTNPYESLSIDGMFYDKRN
ncbi:flagellar protein FliT [Peribacillus sp. NPDC006672]|uniref:flagellar protein FliT n=1 Tax=Peribacillus sp. NPDC006672 TaxID=3390606 RepID=UPI003D0834E8